MKFSKYSMTPIHWPSVLRFIPLLAMVSCAPGTRDYAGDAGDAGGASDIVSSTPSAVPTTSNAAPLASPATLTDEQRAQAMSAIGQLPLTFVRNEGQFDPSVRYLARTTQGVVALRNNGFAVSVPVRDTTPEPTPTSGITVENFAPERARLAYRPIEVRFQGSTALEQPVGEEPSTSVSNYYIGNDSARWRDHVNEFGRVRFPSAYHGVDVVYYGNEQHLEYDFVVAPGVDPSVVSLSVEGADSIDTTPTGSLNIHVAERSFEIALPRTYQDLPTGRRDVQSHFVLDAAHGVAHIALGAYDPTAPLVIDPVLTMGTYNGGTGSDVPIDLVLDSSNNIYLFGATASTDFPTTAGVTQTANRGDLDFFVTKLNSTMTSRVYSTYVGGTWIEYYGDTSYVNGHSMGGGGIVVDASGNVYFTGSTASSDYPVTAGVLQTSGPPASLAQSTTPRYFSPLQCDAVITKLTATGTLSYSTFLGGSNRDSATGIAIDASGNAYVVGFSDSTNFPVTAGAFQTTNRVGDTDLFVAKINPTATALVYATFIGGTNEEDSGGIVVDSAGRAAITAETASTDYPVAGAGDTTFGGVTDGILTVVNATGTGLVNSGYLGGTGSECAFSSRSCTPFAGSCSYDRRTIARDSTDNLYVTCVTSSTDFPTTSGAADTTLSGAADIYLVKTTPGAAAVSWSTFVRVDPAFPSGVAGYAVTLALQSDGTPTLTWESNTSAEGHITYPESCTAGQAAMGRFSTSGARLGVVTSNITYLPRGTVDAAGYVYWFGYGSSSPTTPGVVQAAAAGGNDTWVGRFIIDQASATANCLPCNGNYGSGTSNACPSATPTCVTSGSNAGACVAPTPCTSNAQCSAPTPVCNTATSTCVAAAVALTNPPANGSAMTTSSTPSITGTGVPGQTVTVTEGGTTLCTATVGSTGTWSCTSSTLAVGSHAITATSNGATSMGTLIVQCTTNAQCSGATPACNTATGLCVAAAVVLTNPPAGGSATTTSTTPAITGTGIPGQTVTVTEGTTTICTATVTATGTWSCTPTTPLAVGSHALTATSGGVTSMGTLVVQCTTNAQCSGATPVCNTTSHACVAAAVALTSPAAGTTTNTTNTSPTITGTGVPGATVTVTDGATTVCTATVSSTGTWTCTPASPLGVGSHTLTATSNGATSTATLVVQCTMNTQCSGATPVCNTSTGACVSSSVALTNPPAGGSATTTSTTPAITGTGVAGATVTVTEGTTTICTATVSSTGTWSCTPTTPLTVGSHSLTATSGGATSMGTLVVQCTTNTQCSGATPVCNTTSHACVASSVALTSPPAGGSTSTTDTTPTLTGTGVPGQTVTVTDGTTTICTATVSSTGTWTCTPTTALSVGSHTITATSNGSTSSGTVVIQCTMNAQCSGATPVCNSTSQACVAAAVALTSPAAGTTTSTTNTSPTLTGTGVPGQTVTVTDGTTTVCTATVSSTGTWTCTPASPLGVGSHTLTATSNGATSSATLVVQCTMNTQCSGATPVCNTSTGACVSSSVALTNPPAGGSATTTSTTPSITGTGVAGATVTVTEGAATICTATVTSSGTWSCTPTTALSIGSHALTATSNGATSMGTLVVQCTTNTQCSGATPVCNTTSHACVASSVALTSPPAGGSANTTDTTPTVTGTGVPGQTVTVTSGGTTICTATVTSTGTWSCTPATALSIGSHTITATSNGSTSSGTIVIQCTTDAQCSGSTPVCNTATKACVAAAVALTSPAEGTSANTTDTTPAITGTGVPGATVTVAEGGTTLCTATVTAAGTWTCTPATALSIGSHMISATSNGAMSSATLVVQCTSNTQCSGATPVCNTTLGACVGTSLTLVDPPANGTAMSTNPMPTFTGTGSAGFTVTVTEGGVTLCTTTVATDGTWSCTSTMPLAPGSHTITATSGTATSMGTLVELCTLDAQCSGATPVCNTASGACVMPALTITSPPQDGSANTTNTTPALSGTGVPGQTVTVTDGGTTLCTATVDASGNWSCTPTSPLGVGSHTVTATSGTVTASGTLVVQCTLDAQCSGATPACNTATGNCVAADVTLTSPAANGTTHGTDTMPTFTGTGVPGAMVTVTDGTTPVCTATVAADGTWTCSATSPLGAGSHTITATSDGATSTATLVVDCTTNTQCSGATPVCDVPSGACVQCTSNTQCSGATPRCETTSHTCVAECTTNADCPSGSHCNTTTSMCAPDADGGVDGGNDAAVDAGNDAARDASGDVVTDAGRDAGNDAARDAGNDAAHDAGNDAANDAAVADAAADTGGDASRSLTGNGSCGCRTVGGETSHSGGYGIFAALGAVALVQGRRRRRAHAA